MEYPARTLPEMPRKEQPDPFFLRIRLGCFLFLLMLLAVVVGTAVRYVVQATGPTATFAGSAGTLEQSGQNPRQTTYGFTLEDNDGLHFVRVRNHGRILAYLQRAEGEREVTVRTRRGQAVSLTVRETGLQIREAQAPPSLLLGVTLLVTAIFIALLLPISGLWEVVGWHSPEAAGSEPGHSIAEEE